jgi:glycosyltransferase involved in cell wall biosynthesis
MKIALIGPGTMPIPPDNWGAIESLIWDYSESLRKKSVEVDIFNTKDLRSVANHINNNKYDFIHLHFEDYVSFFKSALVKPFCTTPHYGYIKEHYSNYGGYQHVFDGLLKSPLIFALSDEIKNLLIQSGYSGCINVLRNGACTKNFVFKPTATKNAICLGKIEPRKRQTEIANLCNNICNIDFIGPVIDSNFKENNTCKYAGIWKKDELYSNLTNYKCLVLISNGEAAPLVVPEALSAGLSLVISKTAAANLDLSLPFIHVVEDELDNNIPNIINKAISENQKYRNHIRNYALKYFDWDVICDEYLSLIKLFNTIKK